MARNKKFDHLADQVAFIAEHLLWERPHNLTEEQREAYKHSDEWRQLNLVKALCAQLWERDKEIAFSATDEKAYSLFWTHLSSNGVRGETVTLLGEGLEKLSLVSKDISRQRAENRLNIKQLVNSIGKGKAC